LRIERWRPLDGCKLRIQHLDKLGTRAGKLIFVPIESFADLARCAIRND